MYETSTKIRSMPVCSIRLLCGNVEKKGTSKASTKLKHVISTRVEGKAHSFNMSSNLTAIKYIVGNMCGSMKKINVVFVLIRNQTFSGRSKRT